MEPISKYSRLKIIRKDINGNDVETEINFEKTPEQKQILQSMNKKVKPARYLSVKQYCSCKYRKYRDGILIYVMKKMIDDYTDKAEKYIRIKKMQEEEDF